MKLHRVHTLRSVRIAMVFLFAAPACHCAQSEPQTATLQIPEAAIEGLASSIAQKLHEYHLKTSVVIGAAGPDTDVPTEFGMKLGDEFTDALSKQVKDVQIGNRDALRKYIKGKGVSEAMVAGDTLSNWMAAKVNTQSFIQLRVKKLSDSKIRIGAYLCRTKGDEGEWIYTADADVDMSAEEQVAAFRPIDSNWDKLTMSEDDFKRLPQGRVPSCDACPRPSLSEEARKASHVSEGGAGIAEIVKLYVTVFTDGSVGDIAVIKSAPFGLNAVSVEVIAKSWHLKPATDETGKTIPARIPVEVTFQTY